MILSASDRFLYFPNVDLSDTELDALIAVLQAIIESSAGANRPLEITQFTELIAYSRLTPRLKLTYAPLLASPIPVVKVRNYNVTQWQTLNTNQYSMDLDLNELSLDFILSSFNRPQFSYLTNQKLEAKITYTSGFDFDSLTDLDVLKIKAAFGQCITYAHNIGLSGFSEIEVKDEVRVKYAGSGGALHELAAKLPTALLLPFKKYAPRARVC